MDICGKPAIGYSIEAALSCGAFGRVVVSTDDNEIAEVARAFGAEIDRRSPELATDAARVVDVCLDFLAREEKAGRNWDKMVCLYATAPMRNAADIRSTMELIDPGQCDFAMAVTHYPVPPHQALKRDDQNRLAPMWPELVNLRQSELPDLVVDNGSTYAVNVEAFRKTRGFYGPGLRGHLMPRHRSVDIDTPDDLELVLWLAERNGLAPAN